jgi:hypothetical protein
LFVVVVFLFEFGCWAESSARPSRPPRVRVAYAAQTASARNPATLPGFPRPVIDPPRYRPGTEFIPKSDFPPSNPAPIFTIWLRFSEEID